MVGASVDQEVVCRLDPLPAPVAIHRVVAALDRRDPARHPRQEFERAPRRHVAAVQERVNDHPRDVLAPGELEERGEMLHVRVHATGREQAHQVKRSLAARGRAGCAEGAVREERPIVDRVVDADEILVLHVAGAHDHVTNLAVAHDPVRQTDIAAARPHRGVRAALPQPAELRRARAGDRVRR